MNGLKPVFNKVVDQITDIRLSKNWLVITSLTLCTIVRLKTRSGLYVVTIIDPAHGLAEVNEGPRLTGGERVYLGCRYGPGELSYRWRALRRGAQLVIERLSKKQFDPGRLEYNGAIESWKTGQCREGGEGR